MELTMWTRITVGSALLVAVLGAVVIPTLRMRSRTGRTGYVADRPSTPVHRLAVDAMRLLVIGLLGWCVAFVAWGPEALGVWSVSSSTSMNAPASGQDCGALTLFLSGLALVLGGLVTVVIAQAQMGPSWRVGIDSEERTDLVTRGLFRWVRNPIFSGILLLTLGLVLLTPAPWSVMGWAFLLHVLRLQVLLEEEHLLGLHGAGYRRYASRVGRFLPGVGRLEA